MIHNNDIVFSNNKLQITKKEKYFLCESYTGESIQLGKLEDKTWIYSMTKDDEIFYSWEEKSQITICNRGIGWKKSNYRKYEFSINKKSSELTYFEEQISPHFGAFDTIYKATKYDINLNVKSVEIARIPINPTFEHFVFCNELFKTIVFQKTESDLFIFSYDLKGLHGYKLLKYNIENIEKWEILQSCINNSKIIYPYLLITHKDGSKTLWSLAFNASLKGRFSTVIPLSDRFEKDFYVKDRDNVFFDTYFTSIYIDGKFYDDNLNEYDFNDGLLAHQIKHGTILDVCGNNIVFDRNGIYIVKIDRHNKTVTKLDYIFTEKDKTPILRFYIDAGMIKDGRLVYYDTSIHKFVVDIEFIKSKNKNRPFDFHESYSLMDALDEDPEAYWNID